MANRIFYAEEILRDKKVPSLGKKPLGTIIKIALQSSNKNDFQFITVWIFQVIKINDLTCP